MVWYKFDPEKPIIPLKVRIEGEKEIKFVDFRNWSELYQHSN